MNNSEASESLSGETVRHVIQGSHVVSGDPSTVLTTILGSCVSACMWDPLAGIGGMNHFLLARGADVGADGHRYGSHAMELLINDMLKRGALRRRLKVKLFGGAMIQNNFARIGRQNAEFALQFVKDEEFDLVSHSLLGTQARKLRFNPTTGSAQQKFLTDVESPPIVEPIHVAADDITFF
jgi:chemotaxis protein CheD